MPPECQLEAWPTRDNLVLPPVLFELSLWDYHCPTLSMSASLDIVLSLAVELENQFLR